MGRTKNKNGRKKKGNKPKLQELHNNQDHKGQRYEPNFVSEAGPGCHIARRLRTQQQDDDDDEDDNTDWILEWEDIDPNEFDNPDDIPDVAIDPDDYTLTLCNTRDDHVVAYITVYDLQLLDKRNQLLQQGTSTSHDGITRTCTTLIVLCPPRTFAHLCRVGDFDDKLLQDHLQELPLDSDVSVYHPHPNPDDTHQQSISFPFAIDGGVTFRCTQGEHGILTHFLSGNLHAIDFDCPIGTPLLAVGNGVVVDIQDANSRVTGIAVANLYKWNSIMIQLLGDDDDGGCGNSDPLFIEYVHVQSACVAEGDCVTLGQVIGYSGSAGFSPRPHLHLAAYRSNELTAPTVRVLFRASGGKTYLPQAGKYYNAHGPIVVDAAVTAGSNANTVATIDDGPSSL